MKVITNKNDTKKRKRDETQDTIDESPKKAKVHAQRKFAQGASYNSPSITLIKDKVRPPANVSSPGLVLSAKRPNTEDFLTFLCFRRTSILPPKLDFFKEAYKQQPVPSNFVKKTATSSNSHKNHTPENAIKSSVKKNEKNETTKKAQTPVQALRRKYQEQRLAKQNPGNVTKLAQKVKGKNMIRTRSSTLQEEKPKAAKEVMQLNNRKETLPGLRSGLQRTPPTQLKLVKKNRKAVEVKNLRSRLKGKVLNNIVKSDLFTEKKSAKNIPREISGNKSESSKTVKSPDSSGKSKDVRICTRRVEGLSDFSSDDNEPLLAIRKAKPILKGKKPANGVKEVTKCNSIKTRSQITEILSPASHVAIRPTRKTKEAAALYMEMITKKLVSPEKSGDDDRSSVDSFPELPNARRNEQRETEIKARAMAMKKGNVKETNLNVTDGKERGLRSGGVALKKREFGRRGESSPVNVESHKKISRENQAKKLVKEEQPKRIAREIPKKQTPKSLLAKKPVKEEVSKKVVEEPPKKIFKEESRPRSHREEQLKKSLKEEKRAVKDEPARREEMPRRVVKDEGVKKSCQDDLPKTTAKEDNQKKNLRDDTVKKGMHEELVKKDPGKKAEDVTTRKNMKDEFHRKPVKEAAVKKAEIQPEETTKTAIKEEPGKKAARDETIQKQDHDEKTKKVARDDTIMKEIVKRIANEDSSKKLVNDEINKKHVKEDSVKEEIVKKSPHDSGKKNVKDETQKKSAKEDVTKKDSHEDMISRTGKDELPKKIDDAVKKTGLNPKKLNKEEGGRMEEQAKIFHKDVVPKKEETAKKMLQEEMAKKVGQEEDKKKVEQEDIKKKVGGEEVKKVEQEEVKKKVGQEDIKKKVGGEEVKKVEQEEVKKKGGQNEGLTLKEDGEKGQKEDLKKELDQTKKGAAKEVVKEESSGKLPKDESVRKEKAQNEGNEVKKEDVTGKKIKDEGKEEKKEQVISGEKKVSGNQTKESASKKPGKTIPKEETRKEEMTTEESESRPSTRSRRQEELETKAKKAGDRAGGTKRPNCLPKKGCSSGTSTPSSGGWLPPPGSDSNLVEAPTFYPTEKEFQDPLEFFERIRPAAESFGLCRIVPPSTFKPDCKVSDDMRFTAYNQYVHRMFHRWGPNIKEMMAIKKYLATQSISLKQPPWIGGIEVDLPRLYQSVQNCGGLMKVMEKKKWQQVADMMRIPKAAQDRVTKLDDIYCKYLLPYDTLSHDERQKLFDEVESDWLKRQESTNEAADEESEEESYIDDCEECIVKGRNMALNQFYRIARNTMSMWFKTQEPAPSDVENEFWRHVSERTHHVCVHSGSIDSSGWGYGFPVAKNNSFSRHPWNLKVLTNNSGSVLRSLGPVMGVTVPTLHVGMVFTAFCWYRDPHGLPWVEYLHTGAPKIWYGISDDNSAVFKDALTKLLPRYIKNKKIWLPSDTAMVPPALLVEQGVSLCHTIQKPGQFILVFPRAFTSSICTGYLVSESVYFAQPSWLTTAEQVFRDIQDCCEPTMFSLEKLLFSIATDTRSSVEVLKQVLPMVWHIKQNEIDGRKTLLNLGLKVSERLPVRDQGGSKKRKGRWVQDGEGDYECEVCRTNLCVSLVINSQEEGVLCLPHAIELLTQKRHHLKYCKLMYSYTQEELCELVEKLEQRIESKSQKKVQGKSTPSLK